MFMRSAAPAPTHAPTPVTGRVPCNDGSGMRLGAIAMGMLLVAATASGGCSRPQDRKACTSLQGSAVSPLHDRKSPRAFAGSEVGFVDRMIRIEEVPPATDRPDDEHVRVARERQKARAALLHELDAIGKQVSMIRKEFPRLSPELRVDARGELRSALAWQARLLGDLQAVHYVGDGVWQALQEEVERDLASVHPASEESACEGGECEKSFDI